VDIAKEAHHLFNGTQFLKLGPYVLGWDPMRWDGTLVIAMARTFSTLAETPYGQTSNIMPSLTRQGLGGESQ
jgi:hypothetical protein